VLENRKTLAMNATNRMNRTKGDEEGMSERL
jgi:hypothetical protein